MVGKYPKRRKDKYNPYTISEVEGRYYLSFRDGQGEHHKLEVNKRLYDALNRFELEDLSFLNQVDRHYEHSELTEISLYDRAAMPAETVEDTVLRNLQHQALYKAINLLPETQKRRLLLYYFDGLTYAQIAELENCKYQTVQESICAALKKFQNCNNKLYTLLHTSRGVITAYQLMVILVYLAGDQSRMSKVPAGAP